MYVCEYVYVWLKSDRNAFTITATETHTAHCTLHTTHCTTWYTHYTIHYMLHTAHYTDLSCMVWSYEPKLLLVLLTTRSPLERLLVVLRAVCTVVMCAYASG
jgi:hypothetical protein